MTDRPKMSLDPMKRVQRQALQPNQHMHLRSHQFVYKTLLMDITCKMLNEIKWKKK